jgi:antitoxin component YwqK of YwqJK toxin-antitoxin module
MKQLFVFLLLALLASCSSDENTDKQEPVKEEVLIEVKNGIYYEWYPGKKQLKYKGEQDGQKKRNGIWTFYAEDGSELSVTVYENGLKEGFTVVKYPNGAIHYRGEYHKDQMVGIWTTYDEKGILESEKDFGHPAE